MSALRAWRRALSHGAQWRYLVAFVLGTLLPALIALGPVHAFFKSLFDQSTRSRELVSSLDSSAFFEVLHQLGEPSGVAVGKGLPGAILVALVIAPAMAAAAATVAKSDARVDVRDLLGGVGSLYPRMLRMAVTSLLPFGVASAIAAVIVTLVGKANEHSVLESAASRNSLIAGLAAAVLVWLAHSTVELGRAFLVAEPERRSAFLAWWSAVRLFVRRPVQVLGLCLVTTLAALLLAAVFTAVRLRMSPSGPLTIAIEFLVAQAAVAAIGWGRSSRLAGLVEVVRACRAG
jgi:hypothetical protein